MPSSPDGIAIQVSGLTKRYGELEALKGIDLSVPAGEFFGLLGPNGAGKSTLINILTGLGSPTSGTARVFGKDVVRDYRESRRLIGLSPQEFNFDRFFTIFDLLVYQGGYFGIPRDAARARAEELLRTFDLWGKRRETKVMYGMLIFPKANRLCAHCARQINRPRILTNEQFALCNHRSYCAKISFTFVAPDCVTAFFVCFGPFFAPIYDHRDVSVVCEILHHDAERSWRKYPLLYTNLWTFR